MLIGLLTMTAGAAERPPSANAAASDSWQTLTVNKTFNNVPFTYQIRLQARRDGYRVFQLK